MNTMMTVLTLLAGRASQMYFTATLARQQVRGPPCFLSVMQLLRVCWSCWMAQVSH